MKFTMAFLIAVVMSITAHASVRAFNSSGLDLGIFTDVMCSANLSCSQSSGKLLIDMPSSSSLSLTGGISGDGGDSIVGFKQNQITSTTTTLTIAQCGSTIVNNSADVVTLPEASTALGCRFTFVVANASNLDINPFDATDLILPFADYAGAGATISPSAGDAIRGATVGMSIVLEAVGADAWAVISGAQGTWADVN